MAAKTWSLTTPADDALKNTISGLIRDIKEHSQISVGFYAEQISTPDQTIAIYAGIFFIGITKIEYPGLDVVDLGTSGGYEVSAMTADYYNKILFSIDSGGTLNATEGTAHAVLGSVTEPNIPSGEFPICIVSVQDDGTETAGTILTIQQSDIQQLQGSFVSYVNNSILAYDGNLETAIAAIGATETTLIIDVPLDNLTGNLTSPSTLSLDWHQGCELDGAYTFTINGDLRAGRYKLFGSALTVVGLTKAYPEWWGENTTPGTTDMTTEFQAAGDALTNGGIVDLDIDVYRLDGQWTIDSDAITVIGKGNTLLSLTTGTVLDLRYSGGHKIILGNASNRTVNYKFENFHIDGSNGGNTYVFESYWVRGLRFGDITFGGIYGFLKAGNGTSVTTALFFRDGIEGNMASTHEHFVDFVYATGPIGFTGMGHVEGASTPSANSAALNWSTSALRSDGVQIGQWTFRLFTRGMNLRQGAANTYVAGTIFDQMLTFAIYSDSDLSEISTLHISDIHATGLNGTTTVNHGVSILQTVEAARDISVSGSSIRNWGGHGVWMAGEIDANTVNNKIWNVSLETDNTYDGIIYSSADATGIIEANYVNTTGVNKHRYGINAEAGRAKVVEKGNKVVLAQTMSISVPLPSLADDATPSVLGSDLWLTGGTTTITDFDDGYPGQIITIISAHAITITDGAHIFLTDSTNFVMAATDTLVLINKEGDEWYQIGGSDNT